MSFRPIGPGYLRVLVRRDPDEEVTTGGIVTASQWRKHSIYGTVVSVMWRGVRMSKDYVRHSDLKPGDRVIFGKYSGSDIWLDGEKLTVMPESEIEAVIEP